jgi:hypothetical protein
MANQPLDPPQFLATDMPAARGDVDIHSDVQTRPSGTTASVVVGNPNHKGNGERQRLALHFLGRDAPGCSTGSSTSTEGHDGNSPLGPPFGAKVWLLPTWPVERTPIHRVCPRHDQTQRATLQNSPKFPSHRQISRGAILTSGLCETPRATVHANDSDRVCAGPATVCHRSPTHPPTASTTQPSDPWTGLVPASQGPAPLFGKPNG